MKTFTRRGFIKSSMTTGAMLASPVLFSNTKSYLAIAGANDTIRIAVSGLNSKGAHHVEMFREIPGVRVAALCDVDEEILQREVKKFSDRNESVESYIDFRRVLDNKNIDAVSIATPNHWHSLQAIWATQAGKDVYVEKPVSHNVWEGRKLVEATEKYNRIVQAGTQSRSDEALHEVFKYLQQGNLGKILAAYGLCYKRRKSLGKVRGPQPIPASVDYNLWTGPAPLEPLMRKHLHYDWHWVWPTGSGDIGNQGIHEMDMCRWVTGHTGLPKRVMSFGGRFGYDDDGTTANTQVSIFDYDDIPVIFEVQGLPRKAGETGMGNFKGVRIGLVVKCENGYFAGGAGGGWLYDNNDKKIKQFSSAGGGEHAANFIKAVRSRRKSDLNAPIEGGHISSALCHLGNISYRLGRTSSPGEVAESTQDEKHALESLERFREHLSDNAVDISVENPALGPWLQIDPAKEKFASKGEYDLSRWANDLIRREYREPFIVPEYV